MGSVVVGMILMLALEIVASVALFATRDEWDRTREPLTYEGVSAKCKCDPPVKENGSVCEPVSLPDKYGIAWKCDLKPKLMYPTRSLPST